MAKTNKTEKEITSTLAKSKDGSIQINFTIPYKTIEKERDKVVEELGKDVAVPGFRKGKAPREKVIQHIDQNTLIQKSLSQILPDLVGDVIRKEKLRPAIYPRFELMKANIDEPWEVRALTCELPEVKLGDYKDQIKGETKKGAIWTPDKGNPKEPSKEPSRQEKEQKVIQILLEKVNLDIPQMLVDEEVNAKLAQLLERIEKLGLNLDSYLSSVGKNPQTLRNEYEVQARNSIKLDLILAEVVNTEKITVDSADVDTAIKASVTDPELAKKQDTPEQRRVIESILKRRKALDSLISLF